MKRGIQSQDSSDSSQSTASFLSSQHSNPSTLPDIQEQPVFTPREWKDIFPGLIGLEPDHDRNHQLDVSHSLGSNNASCFADVGGASIETWMDVEFDEGVQNAGLILARLQSDDVRAEELNCYGMVSRDFVPPYLPWPSQLATEQYERYPGSIPARQSSFCFVAPCPLRNAVCQWSYDAERQAYLQIAEIVHRYIVPKSSW